MPKMSCSGASNSSKVPPCLTLRRASSAFKLTEYAIAVAAKLRPSKYT